MKTSQSYTDRAAVGLSFLCLMHCLALPLLLALLPGVTILSHFDNEIFHLGMVVLVIPTSLYALTLGCKQHQNYRLLKIGFAGLAFLCAAVLGEEFIGEAGEKAFTVIGSSLIAYGHIRNFLLCRQNKSECCDAECSHS